MRDIGFLVMVLAGLILLGYQFYRLGIAEGQDPPRMRKFALLVSGGSALMLALLFLAGYLQKKGLPGMPLGAAVLLIFFMARRKLLGIMREWHKERE